MSSSSYSIAAFSSDLRLHVDQAMHEDSLPEPSGMLKNPDVTQQKTAKRCSGSSEASCSSKKSFKFDTEYALREHLKAVDLILEKNEETKERVRRLLNENEKILFAADSSEATSSRNQSFGPPSLSAEEDDQKERSLPRITLENFEKELMAAERLVETITKERLELQKQEEERKRNEREAKEKKAALFLQSMESELTCSICMELFVKATTLGCSHTFCACCLERCKKIQNTCPICRAVITSASHCLGLDLCVENVVEQLSPEDQDKRKLLVEERMKSPEYKKKEEKKVQPSPLRYLDVPLRDRLLIRRILAEEGEPPVNTYYGGYGRCYNCGEEGHWANGCPIQM